MVEKVNSASSACSLFKAASTRDSVVVNGIVVRDIAALRIVRIVAHIFLDVPVKIRWARLQEHALREARQVLIAAVRMRQMDRFVLIKIRTSQLLVIAIVDLRPGVHCAHHNQNN